MISAQSYIRTLAARADAAGASESMSDIMTVVGALQAIDEIDFSTAWSILFGTEGRAHSVMRAPILRNSSPSPRLPAPWSSVDSHVYAAYCRMPSNTYDGGTNYIVTTGVDSFLVSTGQGIAPWQASQGPFGDPEPPKSPFSSITGDDGVAYSAHRRCWSTPDNTTVRPRWNLLTSLSPRPGRTTRWLEFELNGTVAVAPIRSSIIAEKYAIPVHAPLTKAENYLTSLAFNQVWLRLLDGSTRDRLPVDQVVEAFLAIGVIQESDDTVSMCRDLESAITTGKFTSAVPDVLQSALAGE